MPPGDIPERWRRPRAIPSERAPLAPNISRVQIVRLDAAGEREVGRFDQEAERRYVVNDLVEHPDDADLWLVCSVEPAEPPYSKRVTWIYVGRPESDPRFPNPS